jgi:serine/threonine-protein kinase
LRGKYRLDGILGVGGMAVVFAVTHRNGRRFALKMLHSELSVRADLRKRFLREGYIANAVGHPSAVAVLDDDVAEDGSAFLVMELLDGEGLDGILGRHPEGIAVPAALSLAYQLLDVLAAAHAKNIIHRDIKPGNLFATRKGEVKVLDFGIARLQEPEGQQATTRTGMTMGTPAFMSPEQAMGRPIDARADLFSVGATLFTLLSGRFVHQGDTGQELMVKAATEPAPPLVSVAPQIPEAVGACIDRALAFGLGERWQSAEMMQAAVADAFQALTGGEISMSQLASIVTRSQAVDLYAAVAETPLVAPPNDPPRQATPPRTPTMPLRGSQSKPTSGDAQVFTAGQSGPSLEEKGSPITGEPVSATHRNRAGGVTPTPSLAHKPVVLVTAGAGAFLALATAAVVLGLKIAAHGDAAPPSSAVAPRTPVAPVSAASEVEPAATLQAPPALSPAVQDEREVPSASATPRATARASATQPKSVATAPDAGAHRGETPPKVDPWATP